MLAWGFFEMAVPAQFSPHSGLMEGTHMVVTQVLVVVTHKLEMACFSSSDCSYSCGKQSCNSIAHHRLHWSSL